LAIFVVLRDSVTEKAGGLDASRFREKLEGFVARFLFIRRKSKPLIKARQIDHDPEFKEFGQANVQTGAEGLEHTGRVVRRCAGVDNVDVLQLAENFGWKCPFLILVKDSDV